MAIGAKHVVFRLLKGLILRPLVPQAPSRYSLETEGTRLRKRASRNPDYLDLRDRNAALKD